MKKSNAVISAAAASMFFYKTLLVFVSIIAAIGSSSIGGVDALLPPPQPLPAEPTAPCDVTTSRMPYISGGTPVVSSGPPTSGAVAATIQCVKATSSGMTEQLICRNYNSINSDDANATFPNDVASAGPQSGSSGYCIPQYAYCKGIIKNDGSLSGTYLFNCPYQDFIPGIILLDPKMYRSYLGTTSFNTYSYWKLITETTVTANEHYQKTLVMTYGMYSSDANWLSYASGTYVATDHPVTSSNLDQWTQQTSSQLSSMFGYNNTVVPTNNVVYTFTWPVKSQPYVASLYQLERFYWPVYDPYFVRKMTDVGAENSMMCGSQTPNCRCYQYTPWTVGYTYADNVYLTLSSTDTKCAAA